MTKACFAFDREEVIKMFEILECKLKCQTLPTESGSPRIARASEFMLMHHDGDTSTWGFKHHFTRNYVFLIPVGHDLYELYVPVSREPFMRGTFDYEPLRPTFAGAPS